MDNMADEEIFDNTAKISDQIKSTIAYKERSKAYAIRYISDFNYDGTFQDIFYSMSKLPKLSKNQNICQPNIIISVRKTRVKGRATQGEHSKRKRL